jgi:hypothetical protein
MSEMQELLDFLDKTNTLYSTWTGSEFIDEQCVKKGAVMTISIRDVAHFNFNKEGVLLGTSTDSIKSHKKRKIK